MNYTQRQWLMAVLALLLAAACTWGWFALYEKRWVARHHTSQALRDNPMLAATRLLSGRGATVATEATLREALLKPLPHGTLLIARSGGIVTADQAARLLAWVRQGNTLILEPKWGRAADEDAEVEESKAVETNDEANDKVEDTVANDAGAEKNQPAKRGKRAADLVETDPIGAHFGMVVAPPDGADCTCKPADPTDGSAAQSAESAESAESVESVESAASSGTSKPPEPPAVRLEDFTPPGASYPLQLQAVYGRLLQVKSGPAPRFGDASGGLVRVYAEGRGHVVLVAQNYFNNHYLNRYDHAELLLGLTRLAAQDRGAGKHFLIVQGLDMAKWYQALWSNFSKALIGIGCVLLLLLWRALRRFGPPLPEPTLERRSLIEHIDASGRWLWKIPGGREILLRAARAACNQAWQRRAPDLLRLHPDQQIERLASRCNLAAADLVSALRHPAGKTPAAFTRQIQTLRQLRKSHER